MLNKLPSIEYGRQVQSNVLGGTDQSSQEGQKLIVIVIESRVVKQETHVGIRTHAGMRQRIQRKTVKVRLTSVSMAT